MTEVEEDWFVCLACHARHFPAIFSSRRALRVHIHKSKNPKCAQEWSKITISRQSGTVGWLWNFRPGSKFDTLQHYDIVRPYRMPRRYYTILCVYIAKNIRCNSTMSHTFFLRCYRTMSHAIFLQVPGLAFAAGPSGNP